MRDVEYLTDDIFEKTKYSSVKEAVDRDYVSVLKIKDSDVFYLETRGCPDRTQKLIIKETKRIFPELKYLYEKAKKEISSFER